MKLLAMYVIVIVLFSNCYASEDGSGNNDFSYAIEAYTNYVVSELELSNDTAGKAKCLTILMYLGRFYGIGEHANVIPFKYDNTYTAVLNDNLANAFGSQPPYFSDILLYPLLCSDDLRVENVSTSILRVSLSESALKRLPPDSIEAMEYGFFKMGNLNHWEYDSEDGSVMHGFSSQEESLQFVSDDWKLK